MRDRAQLERQFRGIMDPAAAANVRDGKGLTALHRVIRSGKDHRVVNVQIKRGVSVHAYDDEGRTPLHDAARGTDVETVRLLLKAGASLDARDHSGRTPLHFAARYNETPEIINLLIAEGADVNIRDDEGDTPMDIAEWRPNIDLILAIRDAGGKTGEGILGGRK